MSEYINDRDFFLKNVEQNPLPFAYLSKISMTGALFSNVEQNPLPFATMSKTHFPYNSHEIKYERASV